MRPRFQKSTNSAFSMIELMTVIGIMVILAGLIVSSLPGIQARMSRQTVETFIGEIESGLSVYQVDNGIYPQNPPTGDRDGSGVEGSHVLYKHLSGDWNLDGQVDSKLSGDDEDEKVYVQRLTLDENQEAKEPRSTDLGGRLRIIDSFGNPIRYLAEPPNLTPSERDREMRNPTYDLWSITDADPADPRDDAKYITNWGN
ncbi:MAG: type II secretion system protein [Verrucomicrobiota bacterium]